MLFAGATVEKEESFEKELLQRLLDMNWAVVDSLVLAHSEEGSREIAAAWVEPGLEKTRVVLAALEVGSTEQLDLSMAVQVRSAGSLLRRHWEKT